MIALLAQVVTPPASDPWTSLQTIVIVACIILLTFSGIALRHYINRSLEKLDAAATKQEVDDKIAAVEVKLTEALGKMVDESKMKLAVLESEKELNKQLQFTRHEIRNDVQASLNKLHSTVEDAVKKLSSVEVTVARMDGMMTGKKELPV